MKMELQAGETFNPHGLFIGSMVPEWIEKATNLNFGEKLCYARLQRYAGRDGDCFPTMRAIAESLGVKERTAKRLVAGLKKKGLIRSRQRGLGRSNTYAFLVSCLMENAPLREGGTLVVTGASRPEGQDEDVKQDSHATSDVSGEAHIRESLEESHSRGPMEGESLEHSLPSGVKRDTRGVILEILEVDQLSDPYDRDFHYLHMIIVEEKIHLSNVFRLDIRDELSTLLDSLDVPRSNVTELEIMGVINQLSDLRITLFEDLVRFVDYLKSRHADDGPS